MKWSKNNFTQVQVQFVNSGSIRRNSRNIQTVLKWEDWSESLVLKNNYVSHVRLCHMRDRVLCVFQVCHLSVRRIHVDVNDTFSPVSSLAVASAPPQLATFRTHTGEHKERRHAADPDTQTQIKSTPHSGPFQWFLCSFLQLQTWLRFCTFPRESPTISWSDCANRRNPVQPEITRKKGTVKLWVVCLIPV